MTCRPQLPQFLAIVLALSAFSVQVFADTKSDAAQSIKQPASLGAAVEWIPADAAFYRSAMRNREQVEAVLNSRAWAKLCELPVCHEFALLKSHPLAQMAWQLSKSKLAEAQPTTAQVETILNDPQMQRLFEFLIDICSDEVFAYGDRGFIDLADLAHEINLAAMQESVDQRKCDSGLMLKAIAKNADRIVVPNLVMGFRIHDQHLAAEQLGKLELILGLACWTKPELHGRMRRERIDGTNYLTFTLDSRLLSNPQENLTLAQFDKQDAETLRKKLAALQVTIALGIKGEYLLLSVGPSTDGLARLNLPGKKKGSPRLIDREEMQPVARMKERRLTSVCYRSQELNRALCGHGRYIESLCPQPGAVVSICLMSERGMESYCFDRSEHPWLAGYKPLELLGHVGARPLLLKSYRSTITVDQYDAATRWISKAYDKFEDRVLWNIDATWRKRCRLTVALLKPILRQANRVNRRVLIPALQDGQVVFVINDDGAAIVTDTTVAERLREVYEEYWLLYRDVFDALEDTRTGQRPDFNSAETSISACPLPAWMRLAPHACLGRSGRVVIFASAPAVAQSLLEPTPPALGMMSPKAEHPRATVAFIDTAALTQLAKPSVKRTAQRIAARLNTKTDDAKLAKQVDLHVETLLECIKVLQSIACERYVQDGAVVTHRMWELRDVE